jgi:hypothetical protein
MKRFSVPDWPEFMKGCIAYRKSLDRSQSKKSTCISKYYFSRRFADFRTVICESAAENMFCAGKNRLQKSKPFCTLTDKIIIYES